MYLVDNMYKDYKNIPVPAEAHKIIRSEAYRREMSITKLLTRYANTIKRAQNKRNSEFSTQVTK